MKKINNRLRVLFVITTVDGYGADRSIMENILYLNEQNLIDPFVIIPTPGSIELVFKENNIPYKISRFNSFIEGKNLLRYPVLKRNIKVTINLLSAFIFWLLFKFKNASKFDFVYTNTLTTFYGVFLSFFFKCKHIMHIREIPKEQFDFEYEFGQKKTIDFITKHSTKIFCNSEYTLNYFLKSIDKNKIVFIPNPIYKEDSVALVDERRLKGGVISFVIAGRYEDAKNQFDALAASKILVEDGFTNFVLDLYGSGPLKQCYLDFIAEHNLAKYINVFDFKSNLKELLLKYDIGLVCSRYEAFGRITVEYISSGLAVIGNRTGNTPYLIEDGKTGLLYNYKEPEDLAIKMKYFLKNQESILKMNKDARIFIQDVYSIENSSEEFIKNLKELI